MISTSRRANNLGAVFFVIVALAALCFAFGGIGCTTVEATQRATEVDLAIYSKPDSICAAVMVETGTGVRMGYGPRCFYIWDIFGRNNVIIAPMDSTYADTSEAVQVPQ